MRLEPLSMEERADYDQIVFDRVPALATEIRTHALKDLQVFFRRKTARSVSSKRRLPRIRLDRVLETENGAGVRVLDYNYQYMALAGDIPSPELCVKLGELRLRLKKVQSENGGRKTLFEAEDWQTVSRSEELRRELQRLLQEEQTDEGTLQSA